MKNLNQILYQRDQLFFPVRGQNGYAGEQDGSVVLFAGFNCCNREAAKKVMIPNNADLHWARFTSHGWEGSVGIWSDRIDENEIKKSDLFFE